MKQILFDAIGSLQDSYSEYYNPNDYRIKNQYYSIINSRKQLFEEKHKPNVYVLDSIRFINFLSYMIKHSHANRSDLNRYYDDLLVEYKRFDLINKSSKFEKESKYILDYELEVLKELKKLNLKNKLPNNDEHTREISFGIDYLTKEKKYISETSYIC